jgi:hypothetical protein
MTDEEILRQLRERPDPIDPKRWSDMDPLVRTRFHEFGNHIMRLEGMIAGLTMRLPEDPHAIRLMQDRQERQEEAMTEMREDVKGIRKDLNSLTLKIVGSVTLVTAIVQAVASRY